MPSATATIVGSSACCSLTTPAKSGWIGSGRSRALLTRWPSHCRLLRCLVWPLRPPSTSRPSPSMCGRAGVQCAGIVWVDARVVTVQGGYSLFAGYLNELMPYDPVTEQVRWLRGGVGRARHTADLSTAAPGDGARVLVTPLACPPLRVPLTVVCAPQAPLTVLSTPTRLTAAVTCWASPEHCSAKVPWLGFCSAFWPAPALTRCVCCGWVAFEHRGHAGPRVAASQPRGAGHVSNQSRCHWVRKRRHALQQALVGGAGGRCRRIRAFPAHLPSGPPLCRAKDFRAV